MEILAKERVAVNIQRGIPEIRRVLGTKMGQEDYTNDVTPQNWPEALQVTSPIMTPGLNIVQEGKKKASVIM